MPEGFTLDVSLNFDKAIKQMAEFQKKHGTIALAPGGSKAAPGSAGAANTEQATETRKMAQTVRVTTQLFRQLNTALGTFTTAISRAGAGVAGSVAKTAPVAAQGGALANVGKAGAFAMQLPGWGMMARMAASPITRVWDAGMGYINRSRGQARSELSLRGVLGNAGLGSDEFDALKRSAAALQGRTIYGDEALLNATGELATFIKDKNGNVSMGNLQRMMSVLADYASGMGNNKAMSAEELTSLATGLGQAFDGNYIAMRRKGFDTSELEALQERAKDGKNVDPAEKVAAIERALSDWTGRAEAFAKTEEGREIQMRNRLGDVEETIGGKITPAYEKLTKTIGQNLPALETFKTALGDIFVLFANQATTALPTLADALKDASKAVSAFTKDGEKVDATLRTAGGAMALIIGLKFGTSMQKMAAEMATAIKGVDSFRGGINALGKTAMIQGGLFMACSWALGKIGQAAQLLLELAGLKDKESTRDSEYRMFSENMDWKMSYWRSMRDYAKGMTPEELARVKNLPGLPFGPKNPGAFDPHAIPNGLNKRQIDYLVAKGGYDYYTQRANESMNRMNATYDKGAKADAASYQDMVDAALNARGNVSINNNTTNVKQENNISAGFDEIGKLIKENLQEILVSRLNFRADIEGIKAAAT